MMDEYQEELLERANDEYNYFDFGEDDVEL